MDKGTLLLNGVFHTMNPRLPVAEAVAIRDGRLLAVGTEAEARAALGEGAAVRDIGGRCVLPGLTDAHLHLKWYAETLRAVDVETPTLQEAASRVSRPRGRVCARRLDHRLGMEPQRLGTRRPAGRGAPGPGGAAQSRCLESEERARAVGQLPRACRGGNRRGNSRSRRGANRAWTGRHAVRRPAGKRHGPRHVGDTETGAVGARRHDAGRAGSSSPGWSHRRVHDFDSALVLQALAELDARGELTLRVVKGIPHENLDAAIAMGVRTGFGGERVRLGQVKMFADGALGPQTAWMLAPYEGTWNTGIGTLTEEQLVRDIGRANAAGLACAVHAIGDAACHVGAERLREGGASRRTGLQNRLEHAQLLHPEDLARLVKLGVTASMQPLHATSDMLIAERYWGGRCAGAYAWMSLLRLGTALAFGSDCPVEIPDPLAGIHAAVTRRRRDGSPGPEGWRPEQKLTVGAAVNAFTLGAARAGGREHELGSLEAGKLADLTVLDADIYRIDAHEIRGVKAAATIVGGRFVHDTL